MGWLHDGPPGPCSRKPTPLVFQQQQRLLPTKAATVGSFWCWWQLKYVLFFIRIPGEMIQFDEHIFQFGWFNHQLVSDVIPQWNVMMSWHHWRLLRKDTWNWGSGPTYLRDLEEYFMLCEIFSGSGSFETLVQRLSNTLQGTNISPTKALLSRWFSFSQGGIC